MVKILAAQCVLAVSNHFGIPVMADLPLSIHSLAGNNISYDVGRAALGEAAKQTGIELM